jgi:shikimate kinase
MESLQKVITITGIPSSGKSTLAGLLAEFHNDAPVFCVDYVYHKIAKKLGKDIHEFTSPNGWRKMPPEEIKELKMEAYHEMISALVMEHPEAKTIIAEGYGLCFNYDRIYLQDALKAQFSKVKFLHLHKDVSFENWCKYKGVMGTDKRKAEYEELKGIASIYPASIRIND